MAGKPKDEERTVRYGINEDGSLAILITGNLKAPGRFQNYPNIIRSTVRTAFAMNHTLEESRKLHLAWSMSPDHYVAVFDDLLCSRAESLIHQLVHHEPTIGLQLVKPRIKGDRER